jgi:glycosyltransferase involved in cell wall biosynthesis
MEKILIIAAGNSFGGAEIVTADFFIEYNENNYCILCSPENKIKFIESGVLNVDVKCSSHLKAFSKKKNLLVWLYHYICANIFIFKFISNYQTVYANGIQSCKLLVLPKIFNKKTLLHIHDMLFMTFYNKLKFFILSICIDSFISPSKACMDWNAKIIGINKKKCHYLYNHFDYLGGKKNNDKIRVIFVGSFLKRKNYDLFLDIIVKIKLDLEILIIGRVDDFCYYNQILDKIHSIKDKKITVFKNINRCAVIDLMKTSHFIFLTSDKDPLPTVLIESLSCSVIPFARDVGGVKEIITHGYDGFIWDYNMSATDIALCAESIIKKILNDKKYAKELRCHGQEKIMNKFSFTAKQKQFNKILNLN